MILAPPRLPFPFAPQRSLRKPARPGMTSPDSGLAARSSCRRRYSSSLNRDSICLVKVGCSIKVNTRPLHCMGYFSSDISDYALACPKSAEAPFETSNLSSVIKRSVEGLLRHKTYLCAIASGDDLTPSQSAKHDPKSGKITMSIKVVTRHILKRVRLPPGFYQSSSLACGARERLPQRGCARIQPGNAQEMENGQ